MSERRDSAYELKFLVSADLAEAALGWARRHLAPDPYANSESGDGYCVNSVYLDTPKFEVYHRVGSHGRAKYRVRRYGAENMVFLERKLKTNGLVSKRRTRVPDHEIDFLENGSDRSDWFGFWFHRRLRARGLAPKCQIAYERVARIGSVPEGPVRMTVDRNVRSFPTSEWEVKNMGPWRAVLNGQCIVELKYRVSLPALFRGLVQELGLQSQAVSKYRLSVQAFGWHQLGQPVNGHMNPQALSNVGSAPITLHTAL